MTAVRRVHILSQKSQQGATGHDVVGRTLVVEGEHSYPHGVWLWGHVEDDPTIECGIYEDDTEPLSSLQERA